MSETKSWIERAAASAGVMACGVRKADRTIEVKSCHEEISEAKVSQAMRELSEVNHSFQQNHIRVDLIRWQFENGQIRCAIRQGGLLAAVVVTKEAANLPEIEQLL